MKNYYTEREVKDHKVKFCATFPQAMLFDCAEYAGFIAEKTEAEGLKKMWARTFFRLANKYAARYAGDDIFRESVLPRYQETAQKLKEYLPK